MGMGSMSGETHLAAALARMKGKKSKAGVPPKMQGKGFWNAAVKERHKAGTPISGAEAHDEIGLDGGLDQNELPEEACGTGGKGSPKDRPEQHIFGKGKKGKKPGLPTERRSSGGEAQLGWGDK